MDFNGTNNDILYVVYNTFFVAIFVCFTVIGVFRFFSEPKNGRKIILLLNKCQFFDCIQLDLIDDVLYALVAMD